MPSDRVSKVLELAASLPDDERAELADRLWTLSDEWTAEIQSRVHKMDAAAARGVRPGLELTFDEMLAHVKAHATNE